MSPWIGSVTELNCVTGPTFIPGNPCLDFPSRPGCPWGLFPGHTEDTHPDLSSCDDQNPADQSHRPGWRRGKVCRISSGSQGPAVASAVDNFFKQKQRTHKSGWSMRTRQTVLREVALWHVASSRGAWVGEGDSNMSLLQAFLNVAVNLEVTLKLLPPPLCS